MNDRIKAIIERIPVGEGWDWQKLRQGVRAAQDGINITYCPLTAILKHEQGITVVCWQFHDAARKLGIDAEDADAIARAADFPNSNSVDQEVRAALFAHLKLEGPQA